MIEREDARRTRVRDRLRRMEAHRLTCHTCRVPNRRRCNWMNKQIVRVEDDGYFPGADIAPLSMPPLTNPPEEHHAEGND